MAYDPKTQDPRVRRRIEHAMDWCLYNLSETQPKQWSTRKLDKELGHTHRDLGQYLRRTLLILNDGHWNMHTGSCKQYLLNAQGVKDLCTLLGLPLPRRYTNFKKQRILQHAQKTFGSAIKSGVFEYEDKSNRLWNGLQNVPSSLRTELFHQYGYEYNYDIRSAAPTLLYQYAQQAGIKNPTPEIDLYHKDPSTWRQALAQDVGCEVDQAKQIINARFAGAYLGLNNSLARHLKGNRIQHWRLKNSEQFKRLSVDVREMWNTIKEYEGGVRLNSRNKWSVYFRLERQVMSVIQRELKQMKCRFFLEHDGWRCDEFVVPNELEQKIKAKTGFVIQLEWHKCENLYNN